jgi:hypothetical protein
LIYRQSPWLVGCVSCRASRGWDRYAVGRNKYDIRVMTRIAVQRYGDGGEQNDAERQRLQ